MKRPEPVPVKSYLWDPTESEAARVLMMTCWKENGLEVKEHFYLMHNTMRDITSIFDREQARRAHYEYAPLGDLLTAEGGMGQENKFRFSCEFTEDKPGLVFYNYRHLNPADGRWINKDAIAEENGWNLYGFVSNNAMNKEEKDDLGFNLTIPHQEFPTPTVMVVMHGQMVNTLYLGCLHPRLLL